MRSILGKFLQEIITPAIPDFKGIFLASQTPRSAINEMLMPAISIFHQLAIQGK